MSSNSTISIRANADVIESLYADWKEDPQSVEQGWAQFFEGFELGLTLLPKKLRALKKGAAEKIEPLASSQTETDGMDVAARARIVSLVYSYRTIGHTKAHLDPLSEAGPESPTFHLNELGFEEGQLDTEVSTQFYHGGQSMTLRELIDRMERTYCGQIGFEFMHIHNAGVRNWIREKVENRIGEPGATPTQIREILAWLTQAESFEQFLHRKYVGQKRFSLEGGDSLMVALNGILEKCPSLGVSEIVMGMAHRGRLNVLANFLHKPLSVLLYEFSENYVPNLVAGDGDVKYHLGFDAMRRNRDGKVVRIHLGANPSHLEAVNGVIEGKARARQRYADRELRDAGADRRSVLPILIHGDAAFAGQGSVAETLNLSELLGYRTGGTIHIVVNNQIGFTTTPQDARSSAYCTDVAKMIEAPVFHVNGDCPLEVLFVCELAAQFRQTFQRDVVVDIVCYRRHGHNEGDEPSFTQPKIYKAIRSHATPAAIFREQMISSGQITESDAAEIEKEYKSRLERQLAELRDAEEKGESHAFAEEVAQPQPPYSHTSVLTGVDEEILVRIGESVSQVPDGVNVNQKLARRFLAPRAEAIASRQGINWSFAEALAFGSLLHDGISVRLSGQDCRRGTFSQRHAVLFDTETVERYTPLNHIDPDQSAKLWVYNSHLSEFAVLGFEYGYSLLSHDVLTLWEAQFGDFANGAQVVIDQFISSAESKWNRFNNLVMLLPHGYEGQGPEHSSARLERFLQACAENNMLVCNLTTPAQYFHALRRQIVRRKVLKPLVLMTPKSLLTHSGCLSPLSEMAVGTYFREFIDDPHSDERREDEHITRLIFCSGKVYFDLLNFRREYQIKNTAMIRVEQFYPFHVDALQAITAKYERAVKWVWCQEEPLNMGGWTFIRPRLQKLTERRVRYAGRDSAASPSTGSKAVHKREQKKLVEKAFHV